MNVNTFVGFFNITAGNNNLYFWNNVDELYNPPHNSQYAFYICVSPIDEIYDSLYEAQQENRNLVIYLFESAPVTYSEDGLEVITDGDMLGEDYREPIVKTLSEI